MCAGEYFAEHVYPPMEVAFNIDATSDEVESWLLGLRLTDLLPSDTDNLAELGLLYFRPNASRATVESRFLASYPERHLGFRLEPVHEELTLVIATCWPSPEYVTLFCKLLEQMAEVDWVQPDQRDRIMGAIESVRKEYGIAAVPSPEDSERAPQAVEAYPSPPDFPKTDARRRKWAKAYDYMLELDKEYERLYDDGHTEKRYPDTHEYSECLDEQMNWHPEKRTIGRIRDAGRKGLLAKYREPE